MGDGEQFEGFGFGAAELATQRPVSTGAFVEEAHAHVRPRCVGQHFVEFGAYVDGVHRDPARMGVGDVARFLDGVAVGQIGGVGARIQASVDLVGTGASNAEPNSTNKESTAGAGLAFTA